MFCSFSELLQGAVDRGQQTLYGVGACSDLFERTVLQNIWKRALFTVQLFFWWYREHTNCSMMDDVDCSILKSSPRLLKASTYFAFLSIKASGLALLLRINAGAVKAWSDTNAKQTDAPRSSANLEMWMSLLVLNKPLHRIKSVDPCRLHSARAHWKNKPSVPIWKNAYKHTPVSCSPNNHG
jgi:hypothetical protein